MLSSWFKTIRTNPLALIGSSKQVRPNHVILNERSIFKLLILAQAVLDSFYLSDVLKPVIKNFRTK